MLFVVVDGAQPKTQRIVLVVRLALIPECPTHSRVVDSVECRDLRRVLNFRLVSVQDQTIVILGREAYNSFDFLCFTLLASTAR